MTACQTCPGHVLLLLVEQPSEKGHQRSVASSDVCPSVTWPVFMYLIPNPCCVFTDYRFADRNSYPCQMRLLLKRLQSLGLSSSRSTGMLVVDLVGFCSTLMIAGYLLIAKIMFNGGIMLLIVNMNFVFSKWHAGLCHFIKVFSGSLKQFWRGLCRFTSLRQLEGS